MGTAKDKQTSTRKSSVAPRICQVESCHKKTFGADNNADRDLQIKKALIVTEALLRKNPYFSWNDELFVMDTYIDGILIESLEALQDAPEGF